MMKKILLSGLFLVAFLRLCAQADTLPKRAVVIPEPVDQNRAQQITNKIRYDNEKTDAVTQDKIDLQTLINNKSLINLTTVIVSPEDIANKNQELMTYENTGKLLQNDIEQGNLAYIRKNIKATSPADFANRIELRDLNPVIDWQHQILNNAKSVGLVIRKENLTQVTDSVFRINTGLTLGQKYRLCPGEPFADQPIGGEGTAFLVDSQTVITAAHVLTGAASDYVVIFGFEILNKSGNYSTQVNIKDVYYLTELSFENGQLDIASAKLNRPSPEKALKLFKKPTFLIGADVYMIGHPSGLPKKVAINAHICSADNTPYFYTTLAAFQGNSGSPVFDMFSHQVIGILISGPADFSWNGSCNISTTCLQPYCAGERVVRIPEAIKTGR